MTKHLIKNFDTLATTEHRRQVLAIAEAGLHAINTYDVVLNAIKLEDNILKIQDQIFPLNKFKKIKIVGFGKASCQAALALEKILGEKIREGAVIGFQNVACERIETFAGTHPKPSPQNVDASGRIYNIVKDSGSTKAGLQAVAFAEAGLV